MNSKPSHWGIEESIQIISSELAEQPCFVKDTFGRFLYVNEPFLRRCRVDSLEDLLGGSDTELFPCMLTPDYIEGDKRVLTSSMPLLNRLELTPNGKSAPDWQVTHKVPLYDSESNVCGLLGTFESPLKLMDKIPVMKILIHSVDYIREHFSEKIYIAELAEKARMSERTYYRHFKRVFGLSPQSYIQKHRVLEALEVFHREDCSVAETALKCGFYDHSHFTREFKKYMSVSPIDYIASRRSGHEKCAD